MTIRQKPSEWAKYLTYYVHFYFDAPAGLIYITLVIAKQVSTDLF